jgi:hypothetical protein
MSESVDLSRNNLDKARSPYLLQHADNPVHWQEWSEPVIAAAREQNTPLFVSVGYSTCHWCHVMAHEAFSDDEVAAYLNEHFVPIKVDREERPDIDQFLMSFLVASTGQGGWPLNAFVSPDLTPFFALTYVPVQPRYGMPGMKEILQKVSSFYQGREEPLQAFDPQNAAAGTRLRTDEGNDPGEDQALEGIRQAQANRFDREHAGFGSAQKFPPHCTLLYMLHDAALQRELARQHGTGSAAGGGSAPGGGTGSAGGGSSDRLEPRSMAAQTLRAMQLRGLHDHLQGGIFRYCVDREWTVPHFEKMLYDQAMALWYYASAFKELGEESFKATARGIITCLEETFREQELLVAAHDADTEGAEGGTYIWEQDELAETLDKQEFELLKEVFEISDNGNFHGSIHLVRRVPDAELDKEKRATLTETLRKLLERRKRRSQPSVDRKIVTSWNALAGVAYIVAGRALSEQEYIDTGLSLFDALWRHHWSGTMLVHSSLDGSAGEQEYLSDYAAMALCATYCGEETPGYEEPLQAMLRGMEQFKTDGGWLEARNRDFHPIPADSFDSPVPSTLALARMAQIRAALLRAQDHEALPFHAPTASDFANVAALYSRGYIHVYESMEKLPWSQLPLHALQRRGEHPQDCFMGVCRPLTHHTT